MNRSDTLRAFGQGVIELFFFMPILLIAAVYLLPASAVWVWIGTLPFCYLFASLIVKKYATMRYGVKWLIAVGIGALHGGIFISVWANDLIILAFALCSLAAVIVALRGMSARSRGWSVSFSNTHLLIGVLIYVSMQPLKLFLFKELVPYNTVLIVCGVAAIILFFFFANERHLNNETIDSAKTSATLAFKRQNRILIILVVSLISILALFRQIQQMIERFFHSIIDSIMNWLNKPGEQAPAEEPPADAAMPEMPAGEVKPPSEWMQILEQIFKVVGIVLALAVVVILMYFLLKKLTQWGKRLAAKLRERGENNSDSGAGYSDEIESLMTLTTLRERMGNQLKKLLPKKRSLAQEWSELSTNAEKIRYLYTHFLRTGAEEGYTVKAHMTPRETAEDLEKWKEGKLKHEGMQRFIEVYEEVRYGELPPDDRSVDSFKQQMIKKK
ncbi:DUF4129 domain-containing protein [Paenibacillus sp. FSL H8-0548]